MRITLAFLALFIAVPVLAEDEVKKRIERFKLFNECKPVHYLVENLNSDARKIGLTEERLETVAELRLRSTFLYDPKARSYLYVNVNVVGRAYSISVEYRKWLYDPASGEEGMATAWDEGSTGTHGRDANYISSAVSEHIDAFLVEYLRVNEEDCSKRFAARK